MAQSVRVMSEEGGQDSVPASLSTGYTEGGVDMWISFVDNCGELSSWE